MANKTIRNSSSYVKQQKPFPKEINENIVNQLNLNLSFIDINQKVVEQKISEEPIIGIAKPIVDNESNSQEEMIIESDKNPIAITQNIVEENITNEPIIETALVATSNDASKYQEKIIKELEKNSDITNQNIVEEKVQEELIIETAKISISDDELKYLEEMKRLLNDNPKNTNQIEVEQKVPEQSIIKTITSSTNDLSRFEEIIIEVNSKTNLMILKAKVNNEVTILKHTPYQRVRIISRNQKV